VTKPLFGNPVPFQFSGLTSWRPGRAFKPLPVLTSYTRATRKLEGCRKSSNARRCG
jgi:hypothetical protein